MKRLTRNDVALIKASEGVYRQADVARHFDVHPSTVHRVWNGQVHQDVRPAPEPPNVAARPSLSLVKEDVRLLREQGYSAKEIALALCIGISSVYACLDGVFLW